jgi:Mrp family chromosome partitioning ATPase
LIVRRGKTTKDQLSEAYQRLVSVDARVLGSVLNMTPDRGADSYGYGYGYAPLPTTTGRHATT